MTELEIDKKFGNYIRNAREAQQMELYVLSTKTKIRVDRLKSLEQGYCRKSVTRMECIRLSEALGLDLNIVMSRAAHGTESHGVQHFNGN